jgi:hypothetical protein
MTPYQGADGNWYDYSTGNPVAAPVEWWQAMLGTVVTAAVNKNTTQLQPGLTYHTDANGRLVQDGIPAGNTVAAVAATNPLMILGLLAVGGFLLYKLVK